MVPRLYTKLGFMKFYSFFLLVCITLVSCTKYDHNPEIFQGFYKTNALLDFRCVALDPTKLPTMNISRTGENTFTIKLNTYEPKSEIIFKSVSLVKKEDHHEISFDGKKIGDWKVNPYLENKPKLVTINYLSKPESIVYFVGEKK